MPQQLIYTSAPRGVIAGRSGHCTVARSAAMRDALMLQLEKLSYYQHLSLSGGQERPIYCCRVLDLRGSRYHVLTRIQDAGLDFTGRTNFLAHHLVFTPEEIRQYASPPAILRHWSGWVNSWNKDPELFDDENWSSLAAVPRASMPAVAWRQITGDAANGYGLLEARAGIAFRVDDISDDQVLALFGESLELLELRDPRRDFRASAWQHTFTTSMQEQDNPADFRWRCLHADNPASNRFAGPDSRALSEVRVLRATREESLFARSGRQPPRFVAPPQNVSCELGEAARLHAKAEGMPAPAYQWFTVNRQGARQAIPGATGEELLVPHSTLGVTRYAVCASNSEGEITSDVVALSVEPKGSGAARQSIARTSTPPPQAPRMRPPDETERAPDKKPFGKWPLMLLGIAFIGLAGGAIVLLSSGQKKTRPPATVQRRDTNIELSKLEHSSNANVNGMAKPMGTSRAEPSGVTFSTGTSRSKDSVSVPFSEDLPPLPSPWAARKIGALPSATWASFSANEFTVHGSGANISGPADNFFFVQRVVANSVDFTSRVKKADLKNASRHGLMLRNSIKPDASFGFVGLSQQSILWAYRDTDSTPFKFMTVPIAPLPIYLRLVRKTNAICGAYSTNGTNWIWLGTNQITFSQPEYLAGLAVSSGNAGSVETVFDHVAIKNLTE
jgi:hypothetical protein